MSTVRAIPARDETCRQVMRSTATGSTIRFRLSNATSKTRLTLTAVTAAVRVSGAATGPTTAVTVKGRPTAKIAPGSQVLTDSVVLPVRAGDDIAVSFAVAGSARLSEHLLGAATGWCTGPGTGDHTGDVAATAFRDASREGLVVDALEVQAAGTTTGILAVGDSLSDPPLPPDMYERWTDVVVERTSRVVGNVAIGGNRVVLPGGYGPTLTDRFRRDVLDRPGADTLIIFAGTNDVSTGITARELTTRLGELCRQARARRLRVVLVTLAPAWRRPVAREAVRQEVNAWIRSTGEADGRVDADEILRDPAQPTHLLPAYDFGDGLHLSAEGHRALGEAIATALPG
jgi:lysophospholipase L1-like esterase